MKPCIFSLGTPGYADFPNYHITSDPSISSTSVVTDSNGYATVTFTPGGFGVYGDPKYVASATGWVYAYATWNSTPHSILLTWKNYPYLSAETSVSPQVVNVTDNVTITLRLKGDGYKLQPIPADIVISDGSCRRYWRWPVIGLYKSGRYCIRE